MSFKPFKQAPRENDKKFVFRSVSVKEGEEFEVPPFTRRSDESADAGAGAGAGGWGAGADSSAEAESSGNWGAGSAPTSTWGSLNHETTPVASGGWEAKPAVESTPESSWGAANNS